MLKKIEIQTPKYFLHTRKVVRTLTIKKITLPNPISNIQLIKVLQIDSIFFLIAVQHHSLLKKGASQIGISS